MKHFTIGFFFFYSEELLAPCPNPQTRGLPPVSCPQPLIQSIHSYPPHLETIFSICNLRKGHAMVTGTHILATVTISQISKCFNT